MEKMGLPMRVCESPSVCRSVGARVTEVGGGARVLGGSGGREIDTS